jgi:hypothetical protein
MLILQSERVKMFECIRSCTKQRSEDGDDEEGVRQSGTPTTKPAVKSLTAQVSLSLSNLYMSFAFLQLLFSYLDDENKTISNHFDGDHPTSF